MNIKYREGEKPSGTSLRELKERIETLQQYGFLNYMNEIQGIKETVEAVENTQLLKVADDTNYQLWLDIKKLLGLK